MKFVMVSISFGRAGAGERIKYCDSIYDRQRDSLSHPAWGSSAHSLPASRVARWRLPCIFHC